jgi:hypothetical protein
VAKGSRKLSGPGLVKVFSAVVDGVEIHQGQRIVVEGVDGAFRFDSLRSDGSLTCWGGPKGFGSWRSFRADQCHLLGWTPAVVDEDGGVDSEAVSSLSRAARWELFESWALGHALEQYSTKRLAEIAGFSVATMSKYLEESLFFERVKRGVWQVKDLSGSRLGVE